MNEHLSVGDRFFRDIDEFENAPPDCRQTPDGCALDAYLCPSQQWTIGDGCCFWEDGTPVKQGDTLPNGPELEARRKSLLAYNAKYCEEYVRRYVTVPLTQNQFDMLCAFRFNTRETTLRNSSRLLPAVNAQEWQKAANAFTEFVYGASKLPGPAKQPPAGWTLRRVGDQFWAYPPPLPPAPPTPPGAEAPPPPIQPDPVPLGIKSCDYQEALRGLLRRRLWQGLVFLDLDPEEAVKDKDVALPTDRKFLSSGVWRDSLRSEGVTTLNQVKMKATPLASSELVLTQPAPPLATRVPEVVGSVPVVPPVQTGTTSPSVKEPAKIEHDTADVSNNPPKVSPAPTPPSPAKKPEAINPAPPQSPRAPVPPPKPPVLIAPERINPNALPTNADTVKNMADSTRMVGMVLVAIGSIIQVVTLRLGIGTAIGAVFFDLTRDPVVITLAVTAIVAALGWITKRNGKKTFAKGADQAQGNLY